MGTLELLGLHHISGITARAPKNVEFYTDMLGLRLVLKTVNQDDPSMYHLVYGDEEGHPGTIVTFFDMPYARRNRPGSGSISITALRVPGQEALGWWLARFKEFNVPHGSIDRRGARGVLSFQDPEGQRLQLVDDSGGEGGNAWLDGPIPREAAIRGLHAVTLTVHELEPTARMLTGVLDFRAGRQYDLNGHTIQVFETAAGGPGAEVQVEERPDLPREQLGAGGQHHVAFWAKDESEVYAWAERIAQAGVHHSGIVDRYVGHSLYFREPGGVLFEIADWPRAATAVQEPARIGKDLWLPPFLEPRRAEIEATLPPLEL